MKEDIFKVSVIFFPKMFITFAQMGRAVIQTVLLMSIFEQRLSFQVVKCTSSWRRPGEGSEE